MSGVTFPPLDVRLPCADQPELFTRDKWVGPTAVAEIRAAKTICAACPLRTDCLDWAMTSNDPYSIAGGLTPGQRYRLRKKAAA